MTCRCGEQHGVVDGLCRECRLVTELADSDLSDSEQLAEVARILHQQMIRRIAREEVEASLREQVSRYEQDLRRMAREKDPQVTYLGRGGPIRFRRYEDQR